MCMIHSNTVYPSTSVQLLWNMSATHGEFLVLPSTGSSLYMETSFLRNQKWTYDISYSCSIYHTIPKNMSQIWLKKNYLYLFSWCNDSSQSVSSVAQSCSTLCDPMDCSTPGLPVHHQLPELAQIHVHWVGDAIQSSHPLSSPSPPTFNLSQHQGLFKWVSSSHQVAKVLEFQLQNQYFQWTTRTDLP